MVKQLLEQKVAQSFSKGIRIISIFITSLCHIHISVSRFQASIYLLLCSHIQCLPKKKIPIKVVVINKCFCVYVDGILTSSRFHAAAAALLLISPVSRPYVTCHVVNRERETRLYTESD